MVVGLVVGMWALGQAQAGDPETVPVGNLNNVPDDTGYGFVPYHYSIGKYEVTNAEYCEFLNAVNKNTGDDMRWRWQMGKVSITRTGARGSYQFVIKEGREKYPAALMNWKEAVQFCNWLSNGKGDGSIKTGPYRFVDEWGEVTIKIPDHAALAKGTNMVWVLASEDEWYKAAYYDPAKDDGAGGYWPYPSPGNDPPKGNFSTEHVMKVGNFPESVSAYGTLDQGGNLWEFNESLKNDRCCVRGGSYWYQDGPRQMSAKHRDPNKPLWFVYDHYGFRVVALGGKASSRAAKGKAGS
jgi:formylglycine-generating enzyme required for sulfatase activity